MAMSYDNKNRVTGATNPVTATLAVAGTATLVVCTIVTGGTSARTGGNPTYNGVTMTQADQRRVYTTNPEASCEMFYLQGPRVQSGLTSTISVPNSGSLTLYVCISSYISQAEYTAEFETSNGNSGLSANPSVSVTVSAGAVVVAVLADGNNNNPTAQTGTSLYSVDDGSYSDSHQYTLSAAGGSVASGWTVANDDWGLCVAGFKEVLLPPKNSFSIFQNPAGV